MNNKQRQQICILCQKCCHHLAFPVMDATYLKFYKTRGENTVFSELTQTYSILIERSCQHITKQGCKIYDSRPLACRGYDCQYDSRMRGISELGGTLCGK